MCDHCTHVLGKGYFSHSEENCPLGAATYCGICCSYGHSSYSCAHKPSPKTSSLKEISTNSMFKRDLKNTLIVPKDNNRGKHHFLYSQGVSRAGKTEELNKKCEKVARDRGYSDGITYE